eukprot:6343688-Pyramimonas_sp.AAC.1
MGVVCQLFVVISVGAISWGGALTPAALHHGTGPSEAADKRWLPGMGECLPPCVSSELRKLQRGCVPGTAFTFSTAIPLRLAPSHGGWSARDAAD